jgi:mitochondrial distribution and morphology protein 10
VGIVDGSISYLYSSIPLRAHLIPQSDTIPLPTLLRSYRPLAELPRRDLRTSLTSAYPQPASLMYGRLYLPQSLLEALVVKRVTPALQLQLSAVSAQSVKNGGTLLGLAQYDVGRYSMEGLYSSDGGLLGFRGIYNFGGDAEDSEHGPSSLSGDESAQTSEREKIYGRFSAGGEIYYGTLNKSGGASLGARFATLPAHRGTPLTATVTLNPLMGSISASYAVVAGKHCSLATRMDFNVYSYESAWAVGMELWRNGIGRAALGGAKSVASSAVPEKRKERSFQAKLEWRLDDEETLGSLMPGSKAIDSQLEPKKEDEYAGVLKARLDQSLRIGLLWEGRLQSLLFSLGSSIDLRKPDQPFRTLGLEIQFSA